MSPWKRRFPDGAALRERIAPQGKPEKIFEETPEKFAQYISPATQAMDAGGTSLAVVPADQAGAEDRQYADYGVTQSNPSPTGKNQAQRYQKSGFARQVGGKEQEQSRCRRPEPEA